MSRTIIFITRSWHEIGGMERFSKSFFLAMQEKNIKSDLCIPKLKHGYKNPILKKVMKITSYFLFTLNIFYILVRKRKDKVHIHLGDASLAFLGAIIIIFFKRSVSLTAHGLDVIYPAPWYQYLQRKSLPYIDALACVSNETAERMKQYVTDTKKIHVIPNGISDNIPLKRSESKKFGNQSKVVLLTVGRLIPRKGHAWFISNVLPLFAKEHADWEYWIVGKGKEEKRISDAVAEKKLSAHIKLFGEVSDDHLQKIYSDATIFVAPNISVSGDMEGFGIVCIEAPSHGIPVVAAKLQGLKDAVIENKTGLLFEAENPILCLRALNKILTNPIESAAMQEEILKKFSWSNIINAYQQTIFPR